ncbi:hypothetical protein OG767_26465 [Micromonospora sp. NBC_01392]|uniref:hypothetical protein n=1 Tax=Micromonospora sp. NBC_01392 TaxID=2903588 RepID=UPI003249976B
MTDLDQRIASALRERADGDVDTDRLLRGSRTLGRRRQARRRITAGTALTLVGVLGLVGVVRADVGGLAERLPWAATTPATPPPPVPPPADGVPGAATDPARVGTDPRVLHFGVDPTQVRYLNWEVLGQVESVQVDTGHGPPVTVQVARSRQELDIREIEGFSAQVSRERLRFDGGRWSRVGTDGRTPVAWIQSWQPAPGVFARAATSSGDLPALARAVNALRWDEARRCAAPVRIDALPEGSMVDSCRADVSSYPKLVTAQFSVKRNGATMTVWYRYAVGAGTSTKANRSYAGRPAYVVPGGWTLDLVGVPKVELKATVGAAAPGFTEAEAGMLLADARLAKDPSDLTTWP